jgi:hypothetical protein
MKVFLRALFLYKVAISNANCQVRVGYLATFADSIMAEISRLDVIAADRLKSNFISSVSRKYKLPLYAIVRLISCLDEFRSPLHGILVSADLFTRTSFDDFQGGLLETIQSCGRALFVSSIIFH